MPKVVLPNPQPKYLWDSQTLLIECPQQFTWCQLYFQANSLSMKQNNQHKQRYILKLLGPNTKYVLKFTKGWHLATLGITAIYILPYSYCPPPQLKQLVFIQKVRIVDGFVLKSKRMLPN